MATPTMTTNVTIYTLTMEKTPIWQQLSMHWPKNRTGYFNLIWINKSIHFDCLHKWCAHEFSSSKKMKIAIATYAQQHWAKNRDTDVHYARYKNSLFQHIRHHCQDYAISFKNQFHVWCSTAAYPHKERKKDGGSTWTKLVARAGLRHIACLSMDSYAGLNEWLHDSGKF
jgi:hypothetical protein